ncbi:hypothetical protein AURDEDRAFT_114990 [Auricularia subglabra TFB-10046 SS5]|nr:hypothetical protein AURDEDRAFT_114990 [Auricularia subglabra TFB-10046 SS5]
MPNCGEGGTEQDAIKTRAQPAADRARVFKLRGSFQAELESRRVADRSASQRSRETDERSMEAVQLGGVVRRASMKVPPSEWREI